MSSFKLSEDVWLRLLGRFAARERAKNAQNQACYILLYHVYPNYRQPLCGVCCSRPRGGQRIWPLFTGHDAALAMSGSVDANGPLRIFSGRTLRLSK